MSELLIEYDATIDKKRRFVIRGLPTFHRCHVKIYKDQNDVYTFKMEPRVLASVDQLSKKTLKMMDSAMKNFAKGKVSAPVDLKRMKELADGLPD